jgi:hypothetical protein
MTDLSRRAFIGAATAAAVAPAVSLPKIAKAAAAPMTATEISALNSIWHVGWGKTVIRTGLPSTKWRALYNGAGQPIRGE